MLYFNVDSIQVTCAFIWSSIEESQIYSQEISVAKERRRNKGMPAEDISCRLNNTPL